MPVSLSIKDVPHEIADARRARAARNHRSLQGELLAGFANVRLGGVKTCPASAGVTV